MTTPQAMVDVIVKALAPQLVGLLASGDNWTLTLHGGRNGDVRIEVRTTAQLLTKTPGLHRIEERQQ